MQTHMNLQKYFDFKLMV